MSWAYIPFGEWLPDLPDKDNPGSTIAKNAIPELSSFRHLNSLSAFSNALSGPCVGAAWFRSVDGTIQNFAGVSDKLYRLSGSTWSDVSALGGYSGNNWEFAKWGDRVIAVNGEDEMQDFTMASDTIFTTMNTLFPVAHHIGVIKDHVVIGNISDTTDKPNRVWFSGYNNADIWESSLQYQSDYQDLLGRGGAVQRIVPGASGIIFQEHSIWRMSYEGPPTIFRFDEIERGRGTPAPNSVVWLGGAIFFYGQDGFYVFDGQAARPIGNNRVNQWFLANIDNEKLGEIRGAIDRKNHLIFWSFPSATASGGINDLVLIYNMLADKWSYAAFDSSVLFEYTDDSTGETELIGFDAAHKSGTFSGSALTAVLETKEISGNDGRRTFISMLRPLIEGAGSVSVQVGSRDRQQDSTSWGSSLSVNDLGTCSTRNNARYNRLRATISSGFDHANGIEIKTRASGAR